jgi:hypothetical protein
MEACADKPLEGMSPEELEALWARTKEQELKKGQA